MTWPSIEYRTIVDGKCVAHAEISGTNSDYVLSLFRIRVDRDYRGKGIGGRLLDQILFDVDQFRLSVRLYVVCLDSKQGLPEDHLYKFYSSRGFVRYYDTRKMERPAKPGAQFAMFKARKLPPPERLWPPVDDHFWW